MIILINNCYNIIGIKIFDTYFFFNFNHRKEMKTTLKIKVTNHVLLNIWNDINRIVYMDERCIFE